MTLSPQEIYNSINKEYADIRLKHSYELEQRKKQIYNLIPEYKNIEDQIITMSMDYSKKILGISRDSDTFKELKKDYQKSMLDIRLKKKQLLIDNNFPYDYLDPIYTCEECLDKGFIDGEKCRCYRQKEASMLYDSSNIKELLKVNNFNTLSRRFYTGDDLVKFDKAVETCKNFINNFNSDYRNLLFYGTVGTGKTFLSGCVAKELIDKGQSIIYYSSCELFRVISTYAYARDKENANNFMNGLYSCDLLIIDDLGTEFVNEFVRDQLLNILNERRIRQKSIIISTNLTLEQIRTNYTDRVLSRIYETFEIIRLSTFKDIRLQKKLELKEN